MIDQSKQRAILAAFKAGLTRSDAAKAAKVSPESVNELLESSAVHFAAFMKAAENAKRKLAQEAARRTIGGIPRRLQTMSDLYAAQKELLDRQHRIEKIPIFVASFMIFHNQKENQTSSACSWAQHADSLLPETEFVYFAEGDEIAAVGDWKSVRRILGHLMERQGMYPERWRVRTFPDPARLKEIEIRF